MATMNSVIEYVDGVKPNVYPDDAKYAWMNRLEGMVSVEVMDMAAPVCYAVPEEADREMLIPHPFDDLYALYVAAMIDFHNKEYTNYNNSVMMFTERLDQFKVWHIRNHNPSKARNFRNVMG